MFKRQVIQELGAFRLDVSMCEDQEIFLRVARTYPIYCHHEIIADYRRHGAQSSQKYDIMLKNSRKVLRMQRDYVERNAVYREALESGILFRQRLYERGLIEQILSEIEKCNWQRAAQAFSVLVRSHPRGLVNALWNKLRNKTPERTSSSDRAKDN
jgi:hypothetical protein